MGLDPGHPKCRPEDNGEAAACAAQGDGATRRQREVALEDARDGIADPDLDPDPTGTPAPTVIATTPGPSAGVALIAPPGVEPSARVERPTAPSAAPGSGVTAWLGIALAVAAIGLGSVFVVSRSRRVVARR